MTTCLTCHVDPCGRDGEFPLRILLIGCGLLLFPSASAWSLETGDAEVGLFSGYKQGVSSETGEFAYYGLRLGAYQPTLNWGENRAELSVFMRDDRPEDVSLGLIRAETDRFWLRPDHRMDAVFGDTGIRFAVPRVLFEHVTLPTKSFRGGQVHDQADWGTLGLQGGLFTEYEELEVEGYEVTDDGFGGVYLTLGGRSGAEVGVSANAISTEEDHLLSSVYAAIPVFSLDLRGAGWFDSLSSNVGGVLGWVYETESRRDELGLIHVPEEFMYLAEDSSLPNGQTLLFAGHRVDRVRTGYRLEGSGGRWEADQTARDLYRGSLGGYRRLRFRDTVRGNLQISHVTGDDTETRFRESVSYSHRRGNWDTFMQVESLQDQATRQVGEAQAQYDSLTWAGELGGHLLGGSWDLGGNVRAEIEDSDDTGREDRFRVRGDAQTTIWGTLQTGIFAQYSVGSTQSGSSDSISGGANLSGPLFRDWQFRLTCRGQYGEFEFRDPTELGMIETRKEDDTTLSVFLTIERRAYWGRPAFVVGFYDTPMPDGVGTLRGRVYVDRNGNALFDEGDTPLGGILVRLDDGFVLETDPGGFYHFRNVAASHHSLILDPASIPIQFEDPRPDGITVQVYPRSEVRRDWPLRPF